MFSWAIAVGSSCPRSCATVRDALLFIEAPDGVVLMTREQAKVLVRKQLAGRSLVEELMAERRVVAAREDLA